MSKFYCRNCGQTFEMNYFKWIFTALFHTWTKRWTKCPNCGKKSWIGRLK